MKRGDVVWYVPFVGCKPSLIERGVVTSVTDKFVFVDYSGKGRGGIATEATDLFTSKESAMAKTDVVKSEAATGELLASPNQVPDYMREDGQLGLTQVSQYIRPPMLKVVQKQADDELIKEFGIGSVIALPAKQLVYTMGEDGIGFTPLLFYVEWCQWNPMELKGSAPAIRERTTDPRSPLAAKAQNQKTWMEPHPENPGLFVRNVEHMNFLVMLHIDDPDLNRMPVLMTFARGEHRTGRSLCNLITMRRAPIFGGQYMFTTSSGQDSNPPRVNPKGSWAGFDIENHPDPHVPADLYAKYKQEHLALSEAYAQSLIVADHDYEDYATVTEDGDVIDNPSF